MMNKKQTPYRSIWKYALMLPVVAMLLFFNSIFQTKAAPDNEINQVQQTPEAVQAQPVTKDGKPVFTHTEIMPKYPGGEVALLKFLSENINYPTEAQKAGIQGRVVVRFVVTPDGSIDDVEVVKSLHPACDNEAMRVVKKMPNWIPGKQEGQAVYVYYSLPIVFKLQKDQLPVVVRPYDAAFQVQPVMKDGKPVFTHTEIMPQYPGGDAALLKFLSDNINYPKEAQDAGTQGRVTLRFIIRADGSVDKVEVVKGLSPSCDEEAVRVVKMMPKWIPGKQNGQAVDVYYSLPVTFKLSNK